MTSTNTLLINFRILYNITHEIIVPKCDDDSLKIYTFRKYLRKTLILLSGTHILMSLSENF